MLASLIQNRNQFVINQSSNQTPVPLWTMPENGPPVHPSISHTPAANVAHLPSSPNPHSTLSGDVPPLIIITIRLWPISATSKHRDSCTTFLLQEFQQGQLGFQWCNFFTWQSFYVPPWHQFHTNRRTPGIFSDSSSTYTPPHTPGKHQPPSSGTASFGWRTPTPKKILRALSCSWFSLSTVTSDGGPRSLPNTTSRFYQRLHQLHERPSIHLPS